MLVESGAVRRVGDTWALTDPSAVDEVPPTIRLLIAARLDALPPDEKRVLTDASVCGTVAWDGALREIGDPAIVDAALQDLVARGLLLERSHSTIRGATEYAWRHALVRDVAYRTLPRGARADRHEAIARWLRRRRSQEGGAVGRDRVPVRAGVGTSSRPDGPGPVRRARAKAADFLTRRAEQIFVRQARAAEPSFRRALRVIEESGAAVDPAVAARASIGLAEVLIEMGRHDEANQRAAQGREGGRPVRETTSSSRDLCSRSGDPKATWGTCPAPVVSCSTRAVGSKRSATCADRAGRSTG